MSNIIFFSLISYLLGSIPFGFVLTKIFLKKDIRKIGSGNIGATNALRTGNKLIGYLTLVMDIIKTILPILYVKLNYPDLIYICSLCVFLGHVFPIWLNFKGGKGVATYIGILFCINIYIGLYFVLSWLLIYYIFKYSSLGSIVSTLTLPLFIFVTPFYNLNYYFFIMMVLIIYTHRQNLKRLINKEESKTKIY